MAVGEERRIERPRHIGHRPVVACMRRPGSEHAPRPGIRSTSQPPVLTPPVEGRPRLGHRRTAGRSSAPRCLRWGLDHPRCRRRCGNVWVHDGEIQRARAAGGEPGDAPAELLCADTPNSAIRQGTTSFVRWSAALPRGPFTHSVSTLNAPPESTKTATGAFPRARRRRHPMR